MIDPIDAAFAAAATQSSWAPAFAFVAGIASSAGPCVAPRFVAITALAVTPGDVRWKAVAAFAGGLCAGYVLLGIAGGLLARVAAFTGNLYALLAVAMLAFGVHALLADPERHRCAPRVARVSLGGAFLLGGSSALIVSPCCAPVVATIGALAAARSSEAAGALSIAAYALGHALPLAFAGFGWQALGARIDAGAWRGAAQTVAAGLMLALAAYYAVLA